MSIVYFIIGVVLGMYMGMGQKLSFTSAHAHINLLGWVSLAISGLIYKAFPIAAKHMLAVIHFWLVMIGTPLFTLGLFLIGAGKLATIGGISVALGGFLVILGVIVFAVNIFKNIKANG